MFQRSIQGSLAAKLAVEHLVEGDKFALLCKTIPKLVQADGGTACASSYSPYRLQVLAYAGSGSCKLWVACLLQAVMLFGWVFPSIDTTAATTSPKSNEGSRKSMWRTIP